MAYKFPRNVPVSLDITRYCIECMYQVTCEFFVLFLFLRLEAEAKYSAFDSVLFYACASGSPLDTKTNMSGA